MFLRRHSEPSVLSGDRPRHPRVVGGRHFPAGHSLLAPLRDPAHRADVWPLVTLICVGALLWAPRLAGPIDFRYDAGVYYILGTSLAEGNGYRLSNEPGDIQAIQYPPLLPALIALQQTVLGERDPLVAGHHLRLVYATLFLAYLVAIHHLSKRYLPTSWALIASIMAALFLQTYYLSNLAFTELPFAFLATLFLLSHRKTARGLANVPTGLLGAAAFLLRTTGVALLAAWIFEALFERRRGLVAFRSIFLLVPIVLWQAYIWSVQSAPEYLSPAYPYQRAAYQYYNVSYADNVLLIDPFRPELGTASMSDLLGRLIANTPPLIVGLGEAVSTAHHQGQRKPARCPHTVPPGAVAAPGVGGLRHSGAGSVASSAGVATNRVYHVFFGLDLVDTVVRTVYALPDASDPAS
jgi:hypothetical protein